MKTANHENGEFEFSIVFKKLAEFSDECSECAILYDEAEEIRALREIIMSTSTPSVPFYTTAG